MAVRILIFFTIVLFWMHLVWSATKYSTWKIYKTDCNANPKYVNNFTCKVTPKTRQNAVFTLEVYFARNISDLRISFGLYRRYNTFKPFLISGSLNVCSFIANRKILHSGLLPIIELFIKNSNLDHKCPYDYIIIKDAEFDFNKLPSVVPTGKYMVNFTFYERVPKEYVGTILFYFDLVEK